MVVDGACEEQWVRCHCHICVNDDDEDSEGFEGREVVVDDVGEE